MTVPLRLGAIIPPLRADHLVAAAQRAEALGFHSVWTGEAYGGDGVVPLAWAAAHTERVKLGTSILQMPARTPTMTAMTAFSLDRLSRGRLILGLGLSGPQVVEGWHGVPYTKPLTTTREYVAILRRAFAGDAKLEFEGERYQIPYTGEGATGLGKALRPSVRPVGEIPIYIAAIGPKNVALATEIADGLLPMLWNPHRWKEAFGDALAAIDRAKFDVAPTVTVALGDDIAACRDAVRPMIGMYIGGMGAKGRNFYNALVCRYGYEEIAQQVQDLYLSGDRKGAIAAVPDALIDELALVGPREKIADQLDAWKASEITTLILATGSDDAMTTVAELVL